MQSNLQPLRARLPELYPEAALWLAWTFLWFAPWQPWLAGLPWLRFAIGLAALIYPGFRLQALFNRRPLNEWPAHLSSGFVAALFLAGLFGALARLFQLSFSFVLGGIYLAGTLIPLLGGQRLILEPVRRERLLRDLALVLVPVGATVLAAQLAIPSRIFEDDFTYNALLNYYQHAAHYTFQFQQGLERLEIVRFWLAFWPLAEAISAHLSGLNGLLITGIYMAPALVALTSVAVYALGRALKFSHAVAALAVVAHLVSLARLTQKNQAGLTFFDYLIEDKAVAAFVLVPIVMRLLIVYWEQPDRKRLALLTIGVSGMLFTHPVILGMTALTAGVYLAFGVLFERRVRLAALALLPFAIALVFPLVMRFGEGKELYTFSVEEAVVRGRENKLHPGRLHVLEDERFYGIDRSLVSGLPYELSLLAGFLSLFFLQKDAAARYTAAALGVLGLAVFPYTGWIIGLGTSTFQLWRLTWLTPLGMMLVFLFRSAFEGGWRLLDHWQCTPWGRDSLERAAALFFQVILLVGMVYILPWMKGNLRFGYTKPGTAAYYQDYVELDEFFDTLNADGAYIIGGPDRPTNDIIPSLSHEFRLISFRDERGGKAADLWNAMMGPVTTPEERHRLYVEYGVRYVVLRDEPEWMLTWIAAYPESFELLYQTKKLKLYKFSPLP